MKSSECWRLLSADLSWTAWSAGWHGKRHRAACMMESHRPLHPVTASSLTPMSHGSLPTPPGTWVSTLRWPSVKHAEFELHTCVAWCRFCSDHMILYSFCGFYRIQKYFSGYFPVLVSFCGFTVFQPFSCVCWVFLSIMTSALSDCQQIVPLCKIICIVF